jgi:hypothetical protein
MNSLVFAALVLVAAACGGKSKGASDPSAATCCCAAGDLREVVSETVCQERGGTCDPAETCDAGEPDESGGGEVDDTNY